MTHRYLQAGVAALIACVAAPVFAQGDLTSRIDAIVNAPIASGAIAGASVAVVKGGTTLLSKAYGKADLELDVPTPPGATYEIGSVTKQFTAALILLLQEDGRLSLDDEITTFLPDYPTQGHRVTLRRLLNHTSGIRGYTEMREFGDFSKMKRPRADLVALFAAQPFDFAPGEGVLPAGSRHREGHRAAVRAGGAAAPLRSRRHAELVLLQ